MPSVQYPLMQSEAFWQVRPVVGSNSSAYTMRLPPPAMRTRPDVSSVAVWPVRPCFKLPVAVHVPVFGSYSSAPVLGPATRTEPDVSSVAV